MAMAVGMDAEPPIRGAAECSAAWICPISRVCVTRTSGLQTRRRVFSVIFRENQEECVRTLYQP